MGRHRSCPEGTEPSARGFDPTEHVPLEWTALKGHKIWEAIALKYCVFYLLQLPALVLVHITFSTKNPNRASLLKSHALSGRFTAHGRFPGVKTPGLRAFVPSGQHRQRRIPFPAPYGQSIVKKSC